MQSGIDPVKIDSRVLKSRASADCSAQHRGTRHHIGKLPAHPHDFIGVSDAFKIKTTPRGRLGAFGRNHERFVTWSKTRSDDQRAIATDGRINEIAREALRLRLGTDKDRDSENNTAKA